MEPFEINIAVASCARATAAAVRLDAGYLISRRTLHHRVSVLDFYSLAAAVGLYEGDFRHCSKHFLHPHPRVSKTFWRDGCLAQYQLLAGHILSRVIHGVDGDNDAFAQIKKGERPICHVATLYELVVSSRSADHL